MSNKYLTFLSKAFDAKTAPSQEQLMQLMEETMSFFREMKGRMESGDEQEQKKALEELNQIKGVLEDKLKDLSAQTGLSKEQLVALSQQMFAQKPQEMLKQFGTGLQTAGAASS